MESSNAVKKPRKGIYLLPNMITMSSMFLGFLSMIWAVQGRFEEACMAILVSALMDGLDGRVARMTNTTSEFGVQLDSLADLVAFGLAPAMLLWQWQLDFFGSLGMAAAFIYAGCGALRLARFNVSTAVVDKRFFIGLPIPAGGCTAVTFVFFVSTFPDFLTPSVPWLTLLLAVCVGVLMFSRVRYFSFKEYDFLRAHPIKSMLSFLFLLAVLVSWPRFFSFLFCLTYIAGGLVYSFILLPRRDRQLRRVFATHEE